MKSSIFFLSLIAMFISADLFGQGTSGTPAPTPTIPLNPITDVEKWLAISPILLFLLIVCTVFLKLKKDKVSLKDLLLDKDANVQMEAEKTEQVKAFAAAPAANQQLLMQTATMTSNDPNAEKPNTSVSRFLAFISGLVSVGLACVLAAFAMWNYFDNNVFPELNNLVGVLLSLGIGVVPYAFNKISTAAK
ncbi:hypothetical protein JET18_07170 [Chryseobacterium sp. L7]|uniref:Uncharacterized protein n=1 Tax=Chryseobacterium endalhagicum TaxID=2797638 RepID=A0ABS1QDD1_9FLAO|nr:hypothetical protein [Chryseobacterium endalhagicum]MBL1220613.1 hypothetical protein [Chryseobacterium endalhagicum]